MKSFFVKSLLTLAVVASVAGITHAQTTPAQGGMVERGPRGERRGDRRGRGERRGRHFGMLRGLDLSETQRQQLHELGLKQRDTMQAQREELRNLYRQVHGAGAQFTPEQETRARQLQQELIASRKSFHEQTLALLTPEQRTQLEQLRQEHKARREERRARRKQMRDRINDPQ